jgi:predicted sulfurtransferase
MLIASEGISQTIELPVQDVKRVMIRLERLKVDSIELQLRKADISDLQALTLSQANTIVNLRTSVQAEQLKSSNLNTQISSLHKEIRRQKRNKVFAIIGGILTTSGILYLTH